MLLKQQSIRPAKRRADLDLPVHRAWFLADDSQHNHQGGKRDENATAMVQATLSFSSFRKKASSRKSVTSTRRTRNGSSSRARIARERAIISLLRS